MLDLPHLPTYHAEHTEHTAEQIPCWVGMVGTDPYIQCVLCTGSNTLLVQQLVTTLASIQATPTSSLCHLL